MGLDEELEELEDGAETEAEEIDEETELEDVEEFQDDELFDPTAEETDLEDAYEGLFAEEGPEGEGEVSPDGEDGGDVYKRQHWRKLSSKIFDVIKMIASW